jgi:hypothetical protein
MFKNIDQIDEILSCLLSDMIPMTIFLFVMLFIPTWFIFVLKVQTGFFILATVLVIVTIRHSLAEPKTEYLHEFIIKYATKSVAYSIYQIISYTVFIAFYLYTGYVPVVVFSIAFAMFKIISYFTFKLYRNKFKDDYKDTAL